MTLKGVDKLLARLRELEVNTDEALKKGMTRATAQIQAQAKLLAPVDKGGLRNRIFKQVNATDSGFEGMVFTNVEYANYVEFGTGPVGQASPKTDLPPEIASRLVYRQTGWWIHESQMDEAIALKYKFKRIETKKGVFYFTRGQRAQPFMYPALALVKPLLPKIIGDSLRRAIRKAIKGGAKK